VVNTILAKRVSYIVAEGDNPAWPKGSKSRGFSNFIEGLPQIVCGMLVPHLATAKSGWRSTRQRIILLPWLEGGKGLIF